MPYINCATGTGRGMPESVSVTGQSAYSANNSTHTGNGWGEAVIPTLGFSLADIAASSSSVGTGSDIDISSVDSITVKASYTINSYHHMNPDGSWGDWYGGGRAGFTVVLHN